MKTYECPTWPAYVRSSTTQANHMSVTSTYITLRLKKRTRRACRFQYDITNIIAEMTLRGICKSHCLKVSDSFASAEDEVIPQDTNDGGEVCTPGKDSLRELKLPALAYRLRWHFHCVKTSRVTTLSWQCALCRHSGVCLWIIFRL